MLECQSRIKIGSAVIIVFPDAARMNGRSLKVKEVVVHSLVMIVLPLPVIPEVRSLLSSGRHAPAHDIMCCESDRKKERPKSPEAETPQKD